MRKLQISVAEDPALQHGRFRLFCSSELELLKSYAFQLGMRLTQGICSLDRARETLKNTAEEAGLTRGELRLRIGTRR